MTESQWIQDVSSATFSADVVERSRQVPVVVDFWATWCGPCKTLGPMLEKLAVEYDGRFVLAKTDIDQNPDLAQVFQIQSVPTVLALKGGKVVDGFMGALPDPELRAFLDKLAPPITKPGEVELELARERAEAGEHEEAVQGLRALLQEHPDLEEARLAVCASLIELGRTAEAKKVFEKLSEEARAQPEGRALEARLQLVEGAGDVEALQREHDADPSDLAKRIELGKTLAATGRPEEGLEHLLECATADLHFGDDAARKAMLEVFEALGDEHPLTLEFRRRLQVVLF